MDASLCGFDEDQNTYIVNVYSTKRLVNNLLVSSTKKPANIIKTKW